MNRISITGRTTSDLEVKTTQNSVSVCSFTLAVKRPHTKEMTDFVNCIAWRQGAEYLTKYARKGDTIGVSGSLVSRKWEDKDGNKRVSWEVQADEVEILSSKKNDSESAQPAETYSNATNADFYSDLVESDEKLPF